MSNTKHILLVHGMAHDSSCWDDLIPLLEKHGEFTVHTLTLSGHGNNHKNHFRISMHTYAQDVCKKARSIGAPLVLLGHSMGGAVISMAAEKEPELFSQLIYLSGIVPTVEGHSLVQATRKHPKTEFSDVGSISMLRGSAIFPPDECIPFFYNKCSSEVKSKAARQLCPQPVRPFFSKLRWTQAKLGSVRKDYIECTEDNAIQIELQREYQASMEFSEIVSLPADHSPFLSMPEELAAAVTALID